MKIAFIGTHGVGKTTLCHDLVATVRRRGVNADMVREVARLSPLPINRQTSLDAQTWILVTQVAEEIRSASQHELVICDRRPRAGLRAPARHRGVRRPLDGVV